MSTDLIRHLEELSGNAWPAAVVQVLDGWRLRFNWGVTRRANSVWPNNTGSQHELVEKLALVEDFYARWGGPARYQICPAAQPANLDAVLAGRGYTGDAHTAVQTIYLATVLARTAPNPAYAVTITDTFNEEWFATYCQAEQFSKQAAEARRDILQRIGPRVGYALLKISGCPAALGLVVAERNWAGIFGMATLAEFRRQGAASAVLRALAEWSQRHQVTRMYLQVMDNNAPARALYARVGFETLYHYHYREAS
jgi:ribosomal protein S18 acetylase RimI-like enzyme